MDFTFITDLFLFAVFLYAAIGTLLSYGLGKRKLLLFTKPVILPAIAAFYLVNAHNISSLIIIMLFFAFLGDLFLLRFRNTVYLTLGMLSFFIMHLLFIVFVLNHQIHLSVPALPIHLMSLAYLLLGTIIYILLYKYLGRLKVPIVFYILALLGLSYLCFINVVVHKSEIAFVQYLGSLLFITSDIMLSIAIFRKPFLYNGILITLTYILAMTFLVAGVMCC